MQISGFGIHRDLAFELDPSAPAALFFGLNEAGKSTISAFIRAVLFGFPTRANMPERYEPPGGGSHGGILTMIDGLGREIRIERYANRVAARLLFPDGSEGGEAELKALLGGITADLYRNLFAFSLSELQQIETLQREELGSFLFSAGMGVSGSSIVQMERKLAARMDELYKPRGSRQEINRLLKDIEATEAELRRSKESGAGYDARREELNRLEAEIASGEAELEELDEQRQRLNKCLKARPAWARLTEIEERLAKLPAPGSFPEDGLARLEALLKDEERVQRELDELAAKRERLKARLAESRPDERLLALRPELKTLLEAAVRYEDNVSRAAHLESGMAHARQQLVSRLRQIDPDWSEEELRAFPMTVRRRDEADGFAGEFRALKSRILAAETELERLERRGGALKEALEERIKSEEEARISGEAEFAPLRGLFGAYGEPDVYESRLRGAVEGARRAAGETVRIRKQLEDIRRNEAMLRAGSRDGAHGAESGGGSSRAGRAANRRQSAFFAAAALAAGLAFSLWLWLGQGLAPEAGLMFAAVSAGCGVWLARALRPARESATDSRATVDPLIRTYAELRAQLERDLAEAAANWRRERDRVRVMIGFPSAAHAEAAAAGPDGSGDAGEDPQAELELLESAVESVFAAVKRFGRHESELARLGEQIAAAQRAVSEWERERKLAMEHRNALGKEEAELSARWREWLRDSRLSGKLSPETVIRIYQHAEQALNDLEQAEKAGAELETVREMMADFERSAAAFLARLESGGGERGEDDLPAEEPPVSGSGLIHRLKVWQDALDEQAGLLAEHRHLQRELEDLESEQDAKRAELSALREKRELLLKEAEAQDEEHFRRLAGLYAERKKLFEEKREWESAIFLWVNKEEAGQFKETLQQSDPDQLRQRLEELEKAIAVKQEELNEWKDRRGRLRAELDALRSGESHGVLLQRRQEQIAAFEQLAERWAELAFCAELIRRAREMYERERQPGVLKRASEYFRLITGGRYARVVARIGEKTIYAEKANGELLSSAYLSRGTAEQLYLAMRFALADEYAKTAVLPIIMDDIFVNFDAVRLARSLEVVAEAARRRQIVLFTCHDHVAKAMEVALPGLQRIDLQTS